MERRDDRDDKDSWDGKDNVEGKGKRKASADLLLTLGLGLTSGTLLVDRFLVRIPDVLSIILCCVAIAAMMCGIYRVTKGLNTKERTK